MISVALLRKPEAKLKHILARLVHHDEVSRTSIDTPTNATNLIVYAITYFIFFPTAKYLLSAAKYLIKMCVLHE